MDEASTSSGQDMAANGSSQAQTIHLRANSHIAQELRFIRRSQVDLDTIREQLESRTPEVPEEGTLPPAARRRLELGQLFRRAIFVRALEHRIESDVQLRRLVAACLDHIIDQSRNATNFELMFAYQSLWFSEDRFMGALRHIDELAATHLSPRLITGTVSGSEEPSAGSVSELSRPDVLHKRGRQE